MRFSTPVWPARGFVEEDLLGYEKLPKVKSTFVKGYVTKRRDDQETLLDGKM